MQTIPTPEESLLEIKGSKFLGLLTPIDDEKQHSETVNSLWSQHPGACHVCWGWRILGNMTPQPQEGFSDDGEPNGSAGKPILAPLRGANAIQVGIYIVRYYGGTKLGVGGLVRAYGGLAADMCKVAQWQPFKQLEQFRFEIAYQHQSACRHELKLQNLEVLEEGFSEGVKFTVRGEAKNWELFCDKWRRFFLDSNNKD